MIELPTGRQTFARIDTAALQHNFAVIRSRVPTAVDVFAVVKANAYGHDARIVAPVLESCGAAAFGVATLDEAVELREAGIERPILVLGGGHRRDVATLVEHRLSVALVDAAMARELTAAPRRGPLRVHLKVETGMGRLGTLPDDLPEILEIVQRCDDVEIEGVFSHFANADDVFTTHCEGQFSAFGRALAVLSAAGVVPRWRHLANSAATMVRPETHFDMVRPGIALYGLVPSCVPGIELRPVMRVVTHVLQVKEMAAGLPVSYSQNFTTQRPSRIAVLPVGYADGYSRALSNRAQVLVRGVRAPVVGNVCMDLTMIDVTDVPGVAPGDEVVLWGTQAGATISADDVGGWQGSIGYEVLNRLGKRVPRLAA